MKGVARLLALIMATFALALGCSSGSGGMDAEDYPEAARETIGPAGGTVELIGHGRLTVPAGALADTITFSLERNDSPAAPPVTRRFMTDVYSIEPSGTAFTTPATVTLEYDEGDLAGEDESSIVIYTDDGRGWDALTTTVSASEDEVSVDIDHLSDFAATVNDESQEPVFATLRIHRSIMDVPGSRDPFISDSFEAWLDSTAAPSAPARPIMVDAVTCNEYTLVWSAPETMYTYAPFIPFPFLVEGETYTYDVDGGAQAPDLTVSIDFPSASPYITDPQMNGAVSLGGFTVTWDGAGGESIVLSIVGTGGTGLIGVETANDGSYTFSASELSGLSAGVHALTLNCFNSENIDEPGYDSGSYIRAQVTSTVNVTMQ